MPHENDHLKHQLEHQLKSFQMPANLVIAELGEVNVHIQKAECHVQFTIAMEPQGRFAEGWRTGLALDASASMKRAYGRKVEARVDPELLTSYIKQGRLRSSIEDGEPIRKIQRDAFVEMQERGYEINYTENILQPLVQNFAAYLADSLDRTGKTSLIYWGCGEGGAIQALGEFDAASCRELAIAGPATFQLGKTTQLLPAIAHFTNQNPLHQYTQAQRGIYVFLTDGRIDDLEQVKNYTRELALEIAVGKRNYVKLVLIGIGNDVDRYQLQELDDFDTGVDIDIWDYKIASEMSNLSQIFAEVINENEIIAENGAIYDDIGTCVKSYPNGLPAKVDFVMRHDSRWFELEVANQRIRQSVVLDKAIAPLAKKNLLAFEVQAAALIEQQNIDQQNMQLNQSPIQNPWWRWLAALLIGSAFISTAIAFGILIKRSDDNKLQNQAMPNQTMPSLVKESELKPKPILIDKTENKFDKSISNLSNSSTNSDNNPNNINKNLNKNISDISKKIAASNSINFLNQKKTSDRSISASILPIANPDVEVVVYFPSDETQLMFGEESKIDDFWMKIQKRKGIIQVSGHADKTGDYAYNLDLSQSRANEVVRLLRDRGLDNNYKVTFVALSWLHPLRKDITVTDNAFNRRVVIQFKAQR